MQGSVQSAIYLVLLLGTVRGANPGNGCPDPQRFSPCKCSELSINCDEAKNTEELSTSFNEEFKDYGVFSVLIINGSTVHSLPTGIFKSIRAKAFSITHNNQLNYVSEFAFEGSENHIRTLILNNNKIDDTSVFGAAKRLKNLKSLHLFQNGLTTVPDNALSSMENLEIINLQNNLIVSIGTRAFANLTMLKAVRLNHNRLTTIGDEAFAFGLPGTFVFSTEISLPDNELTDFGRDTFRGIQRDIRMDLSDNYISTLAENVFGDLIKYFSTRGLPGQKNTIKVTGNPLKCDCNARWLKNDEYALSSISLFVCDDNGNNVYLSSMKIEDFPEECRFM